MRPPHPDDVLIALGHMTTPEGPRVSLYAEVADTDRRLMSLTLHPEQFAQLMAAKVIIVRSETAVDHPPVVQHPPVNWLNVTLHATTNRYLPLPCDGQLQIIEHGTDGSIITAIFRRRGEDGVLSAPVEVKAPRFTYADRRSAPAPAARPQQQAGTCSEVNADGWACGMWDHVAHTAHVFTVPPPETIVIPAAEADSEQDARRLAGVTLPYLGVFRSVSDRTNGRLHVFSARPSVVRAQGYVKVVTR